MRRIGVACLVGAFSIAAGGCGDRAGLPTPLEDNPRVYDPAPCDPPADTAHGPATFKDLYADIFSTGGVAQCQNKACHGRLADDQITPVGQICLGMSSETFRSESPGTPFGNPAGVYCAMTGHTFGGRPVVSNDPAPKKHAYRVKSDPSVPAGTKVCCEKGDLLYKATDCDGGANATTDVAADPPCAVSTAAGKCVVAWCRNDFILEVLDRNPDPTHTRPEAGKGFMPYPLNVTCNRVLTTGELDRIFSWLEKGAPYDGFAPGVKPPRCNKQQVLDDGACKTSAAVCGLPPGNRPCD